MLHLVWNRVSEAPVPRLQLLPRLLGGALNIVTRSGACTYNVVWRRVVDIPSNAADVAHRCSGLGLSVSATAYSNNLKHLKDNVLPIGWELNAVQKWDAYGHGIRALACAAAKLAVSISVLTNQEAGDVLAAAQAAGISRPVIRRIMPRTGPAKYAEVLEAARAGLGVQVGVESVRKPHYSCLITRAQDYSARYDAQACMKLQCILTLPHP